MAVSSTLRVDQSELPYPCGVILSGMILATAPAMARPLRFCVPGAFYHVMARGNARAPIFLDAQDYQRFLEILEEVAVRFSVVCYAYCLMPNHYHLVIQTRQANLSAAIGHLNSVYAQGWNGRHGRCGHVTQGRFKAQVIQHERYLVAVCRYVVLNPIRAGLVEDPAEWRWSSYRASAHLTVVPPFMDTKVANQMVAHGDNGHPEAVPRGFVDGCQAEPDVGRAIREDARFLGDQTFLGADRELMRHAGRSGFARSERRAIRPTLAEVFVDSRTKLSRNQQILKAHDDFGFTLPEIAVHLRLHLDTVGRVTRAARLHAIGSTGNRVEPAVPAPQLHGGA